MANPNIISVFPQPNAQDVILGTDITVTFDSLMDISTITTQTFSLTGPAQTQILTTNQLIQQDPTVLTGRNYITGKFALTVNPSNSTQSILTFTPSQSLQPNSNYTVLLIGVGALLVTSSIKDVAGDPLSANYQWSFATGDLNTSTPPLQSPLAYQFAAINPDSIKIRVNGNNLGDYLNQSLEVGYTIDLIFPVPLDTTSFEPSDLLISLEQFLGDPTIPVPSNITPVITVAGNTISITLTAD